MAMVRKRRAPSPAPPPPQESSTEEEEEPLAAAAQKPPQNPQPHPPADEADSSEEESDSDANTHAFRMRPVSHSPVKPEPDADEEEDGESEPEVPEPVQKKAKAEAGKAAPEATSAVKGKKAKALPEKAAPEQAPYGKPKQPGGKLEKSGLHSPTPLSKSDKFARAQRVWSKEDSIKILEAIAALIKSEGALPNTNVLLSTVCDRIDRKDCNYTDMYETVRRLKDRYQKAVSRGVVPSGEDELRMYNLSEAIWGEKATEAIAAAASQNGSTVAKSKKGQDKKEKMDGNSKDGTLREATNQNGDTQKCSKKGHAIELKTDRDVKSRLSKEDTTTGTLSKIKQQGNDRDELGKDAKNGILKETTTTATQNGDVLMKRKRGKMDIDLMPKEASTGSQNGGTQTEEETHEEETERGANVQGTLRSFDELQNLYPNLAGCVERVEAQHPCGETLRRAFGFIGDEKANALESKIKAQRLLQLKAHIRRGDLKKEVLNMLIRLTY